jgi:hypothetical protein
MLNSVYFAQRNLTYLKNKIRWGISPTPLLSFKTHGVSITNLHVHPLRRLQIVHQLKLVIDKTINEKVLINGMVKIGCLYDFLLNIKYPSEFFYKGKNEFKNTLVSINPILKLVDCLIREKYGIWLCLRSINSTCTTPIVFHDEVNTTQYELWIKTIGPVLAKVVKKIETGID